MPSRRHAARSIWSAILSAAILAAGAAMLGLAATTSETPERMKSVRIHEHGGPEMLRYEVVPVPKLGEGDVLIRVHAAGVNPVDWKIASGGRATFGYTLPLVLGWDAAGVIEQVGPGATRFKVGDPVFAYQQLTRDGAYAEYMAIREDFVASKPANASDVEAAGVPLAGLTAWQALFDKAGLKEGQTVLIHGAAGGVGSLAVQLAKAKGARVIGTASEGNHEFLRSIGADEVIDYRTTRFEDVVKNVDVVLDTVGGDTLARSYGVVKKGGIVVSIAGSPSEEKAAEHGVRALRFLVQPNGEQLAEIGTLIEAGKVRPIVTKTLPLAQAGKAHEMSRTGRTRGKIVLVVKGEE